MPLEIKEVRIRANLEKGREAGGTNRSASTDFHQAAPEAAVPDEAMIERVVERLLVEHLDRIKEALDQMER